VTAALAAQIEVHGMIERLADTTEVLEVAAQSGDWVTVRYAAATVTELGDRIEAALLAVDTAARGGRLVVTA